MEVEKVEDQTMTSANGDMMRQVDKTIILRGTQFASH